MRADILACSVLGLLFVAASAIVGSHGDFPLNDDWAYSETTRNLIESGRFERSDWTWVPMITHALVGSLFSWLFGFSFESLRLSGIFMGCLGVMGTYVLCRQIGVRMPGACLGAAVVGLNPMHFNLSHTFMMDVPFATIMTWSLVCLCRGLNREPKTGGWIWISLGTFLALAAVLSRQPGLAIPIALVMVMILLATRPGSRSLLAAAGAIVVVTAFTHLAVPDLVFGPRDAGKMMGFAFLQDRVLDPTLFWHVLVNSLAEISYLGVFLAPVTLGLALTRRTGVWLVGASLVLTGLSQVVISRQGLHVPLGQNVIYDLGLGVPTLLGWEHLPRVGPGFWGVLTLLGLGAGFVAFGALLVAGWNQRHRLRERADVALLVIVPCVYLPPLLVRSPCFDRYLLPILPPLIALLLALAAPRTTLLRRVLRVMVLAALAFYAIAGTRDYMEHHRCRATLLDKLTGQGVAPGDIHGGFEFMFWKIKDRSGKIRWEQLNGERFVVTFSDRLDDYEIVDESSYERWLPPGRQRVFVMRAQK